MATPKDVQNQPLMVYCSHMLSPPTRTSRPVANARARKLLVSLSATLLISFLAAFHAVLLWQRVIDLSLFRPIPAIRWLATLAFLVALYRLHRGGVSLVKGRSALVFWLLVLLLHVGFQGPLASPAADLQELTGGAGLLLALPAITVTLGCFFPAIRRLLARVFKGLGLCDLPYVAPLRDSQAYSGRAGFLPILCCRPPPAWQR